MLAAVKTISSQASIKVEKVLMSRYEVFRRCQRFCRRFVVVRKMCDELQGCLGAAGSWS